MDFERRDETEWPNHTLLTYTLPADGQGEGERGRRGMTLRNIQIIALLLVMWTACASTDCRVTDHKSAAELNRIILPGIGIPKPIPVADMAHFFQEALTAAGSDIRVVTMPSTQSLFITNDWPTMCGRRPTALEYCRMMATDGSIAVRIENRCIIIDRK